MDIDEIDLTSRGSVTARRSARPIVAPIPTEVIMSASSKDCSVELTGKEYLQGGIMASSQVSRRSMKVATWTSSCCVDVSKALLK